MQQKGMTPPTQARGGHSYNNYSAVVTAVKAFDPPFLLLGCLTTLQKGL